MTGLHRRSTGSTSLWGRNARTSLGDLRDNEQKHSDEAVDKSQQLLPSRQDQKEAGYKPYLDRPQRAGSNKWAAETIALIMSMLALGGLVSILLTHQTKPLPNWPRLVTINAIISLFSLIMRAAVGVILAEGISQCKWNWARKAKKLDHMERLDSASRGSWGCIVLLYYSRPNRLYFLAALGSFIMIMASLTGFFLQQLVHFGDCLAKDAAASASISRTNAYNPSPYSSKPLDISNSLMAAIIIGLLQSPGDQTTVLATGCTSGNCTFADDDSAAFSTLAVTHLCHDLTSQIRVLPGNDSYSLTFLTLDYGVVTSYIWPKTTTESPSYATVWSWCDYSTPAVITLIFVFRDSSVSSDWKAMNCSISPAINTYKASITNNVLEETLVNTTPLDWPIEWFDDDSRDWYTQWRYATATKNTLRNGLRVPCEGSSSTAAGLTPFLITSGDPDFASNLGLSTGSKWWYYPEDCVWRMSSYAFWGMRGALVAMFEDRNITQIVVPGADQQRYPFQGPALLKSLYEDGNMTFHSVDQRMKGLATSISTVIRTSDQHTDTRWNITRLTFAPATGIVWNTTTCVYIRWAWIAFPAVMISLTGIFLILVALENRGVESDRLWKSSFLAVLFCELETHERPVGKREMHEVAKSTSVSLDGNSKALRLVVG
ncbi:hypothetical protein IQ07DRAFT_511955 [Pyrenochaeta sp. DS3sAY3a]|nr:hypothetical protein IQ07DRAFT_511955 [Pyrenochaeta sp. DS3sAY3a]